MVEPHKGMKSGIGRIFLGIKITKAFCHQEEGTFSSRAGPLPRTIWHWPINNAIFTKGQTFQDLIRILVR